MTKKTLYFGSAPGFVFHGISLVRIATVKHNRESLKVKSCKSLIIS
jgi:hypothetical protein